MIHILCNHDYATIAQPDLGSYGCVKGYLFNSTVRRYFSYNKLNARL